MRRATCGVLAAIVAGGLISACAPGSHRVAMRGGDRAPVDPSTAVAAPPAGFTANEFRVASPFGNTAIGGIALPRPKCARDEITATAATRSTIGGVLGVVRLLGAKVRDSHGDLVRCALPIARGPAALYAADGQRLSVPRSAGDTTSPPSNPRPDLALSNGDAVWGFAWFGSYCGRRPDSLGIPLLGGMAPLRAPLHGPQPTCDPQASPSFLIDGIAGRPGQAVQPPRPDYSNLRLTGHIRPGTSATLLAPIRLTLTTTGSRPITLDPCPAYAGRDTATAHTGGFSDPIRSSYLNCTTKNLLVRPGRPVHLTVRGPSLVQTPGTGAVPGSTVSVELGIAGVALLHLTTTAH